MEGILNFEEWLDLDNLQMWDYEGTQCLGVGDDFRAVFRPILKDLQQLHDQQHFNGRLRESLRIHFEMDVVNPLGRIFKVEFIGEMDFGELNFLSGLQKDLIDFNTLVREATAAMQEDHRPDSLKLYFHEDFQRLLNRNIRENRHFFYFNPLFYNSADRNRLYHKVCELRRRHDIAFYNHVTLTSTETSMRGWHNRVAGNQTPLRQVYNFQIQNNQVVWPAGIIRYLRNVAHHYQDYSFLALSSEVSEALYRLFPDACPKIYFEIVKHFRGRNGERYFRIKLVSFLKDGPYGFPG